MPVSINSPRPLSSLKELITIVSPRTFARWVSAKGKTKVKRPSMTGRRPKPLEIRQLILKLARENGWGYTRILGELKKLGAGKICRSTVVNILKENGLDPGPKRGAGSWDEFLKSHMQTLWGCDFLTQRVLTLKGWVDYHLVLFVHLESRRLFVTPATRHPTAAWVTQQARNFTLHLEAQGLEAQYVIVDNDTKFCQAFDGTLNASGTDVVRTQLLSPNMNSYAERAIQTLQVECLDKFIVCGEKHLNYLVAEFLAHYHEERPHQSKGNAPLTPPATPPPTIPPPDAPLRLKDIACRQRLGGVLKHYYRRAA